MWELGLSVGSLALTWTVLATQYFRERISEWKKSLLFSDFSPSVTLPFRSIKQIVCAHAVMNVYSGYLQKSL